MPARGRRPARGPSVGSPGSLRPNPGPASGRRGGPPSTCERAGGRAVADALMATGSSGRRLAATAQVSERLASGWSATVARRLSNSCSSLASNSAIVVASAFGCDVHDAVALGLQLRQQARQRPRRRGMDVVEEDDALLRPRQIGHHLAMHGAGIPGADSPCCPRRWRRWRSAAPADASIMALESPR